MIVSLLDAIARGWALYLEDTAHDLEQAAVMATPVNADELLDRADFMHKVARDLLVDEDSLHTDH